MDNLVIHTTNGQTLTFVETVDGVTVRIAKDGHNRGIAKVTTDDSARIAEWLNR